MSRTGRRAALAAGLMGALALYRVEVLHRPLFAAGCAAGWGASCVEAGWAYVGDHRQFAVGQLTRGCERLRDPESCSVLTHFLAVGLAGPADFERAERMCLEGDRRYARACVTMADLTILNQFGSYDRQKRTVAFLAHACALGEEPACRRVAAASREIDAADQMAQQAKACADGDRDACQRITEDFRAIAR